MIHKAVFFDRDGVINRSPGPGKYVTTPEEFHFLPGVQEVLTYLKRHDWLTVLITNQQCVGKQIITEEGLLAVHEHMQSSLGPAAFDHVTYCPHLKNTCECRKPLPGMVKTAAKLLDINVSRSCLVGDNDSDILCGEAAEVGTLIRFISEKDIQVPAHHTITNHFQLLEILSQLP